MSTDAPREPGSPARASTGVAGLHHVAVVSRDAARAADFYGRILGLADLGAGEVPLAGEEWPGRLATAPARWFGAAPRPGGLVAVVERPDAPQGAPGVGGTHHFALAVADRDALLMWKGRLLDEGYAVDGILDRHYFQSIYVKDPDGQIVELATMGPGWTRDETGDRLGEEHRDPPPEMIAGNRDRARIAAERWPDPVREVTARMRIPGLHHVTAIGTTIERTEEFVAGRLGMRRVKRTNNFDDVGSLHWYWGVGGGAPGTLVTYFDRRPERARRVRPGAGQLAYWAVAADADRVHPLAGRLADAGVSASPATVAGPEGTRFAAIATLDPDGHPVLVAAVDGPTTYDDAASAAAS